MLLARIYEIFPLRCALCGAEMRIIAFITQAPAVNTILGHLGEPTTPPEVAPARGPPLWDTVAEPVPRWGDSPARAPPLLESRPELIRIDSGPGSRLSEPGSRPRGHPGRTLGAVDTYFVGAPPSMCRQTQIIPPCSPVGWAERTM